MVSKFTKNRKKLDEISNLNKLLIAVSVVLCGLKLPLSF